MRNCRSGIQVTTAGSVTPASACVGHIDEWHVDLRKPNLKNGLREVRICAFWPAKHA